MWSFPRTQIKSCFNLGKVDTESLKYLFFIISSILRAMFRMSYTFGQYCMCKDSCLKSLPRFHGTKSVNAEQKVQPQLLQINIFSGKLSLSQDTDSSGKVCWHLDALKTPVTRLFFSDNLAFCEFRLFRLCFAAFKLVMSFLSVC